MTNMDISAKIISFFGFVVALTMHEAAHAYMAEFLGDNSISTKERATINPVPHIDILGTIIFPLFMILTPSPIPIVFGWAKPVLFSSSRFKKIRRDLNLVALAGPGANFLIAFICGVVARFQGVQSILASAMDVNVRDNIVVYLLINVSIANLVIGVFNLLPFPNSDGWRIMANSVNHNLAVKLEQHTTTISIIMLALLLLGGLNYIILPCLFVFDRILSLVG